MSKWIEVGSIDDIPVLGARVVQYKGGNIAVFRNSDDEIFAVLDQCPHKKGQLSQGIMHDKTVTCPLHNWKIDLQTGEAKAPDKGCARNFPVKLEATTIFIEIK